MFTAIVFTSLCLSALVAPYHAANAAAVSLFIPGPGIAEQAITADVQGIDSEGRTTWILKQGTPSGTLNPVGPAFTATLVAGPKDVHIVQDNVEGLNDTLNQDCGINEDGSFAVCTLSASGAASVGVFTTSVVQFEVQAGMTTVPPTPTSTESAAATSTASTTTDQTQTQSPKTGNGAVGSLGATPMSAVMGAVGLAFAVVLS
ncbi:hypothetical protein C8Q74DRAFT_360490 [Fomes fomentarius]|nr:hypothetical protein C8Q74DRAFT_360490 [Fomes fomentarius]